MASATPQVQTISNPNSHRENLHHHVEMEYLVELNQQQFYPPDWLTQNTDGTFSCRFFANTLYPSPEEKARMQERVWTMCQNVEWNGSCRCHCDLCMILKSRMDHFLSTQWWRFLSIGYDGETELFEYTRKFVSKVMVVDGNNDKAEISKRIRDYCFMYQNKSSLLK